MKNDCLCLPVARAKSFSMAQTLLLGPKNIMKMSMMTDSQDKGAFLQRNTGFTLLVRKIDWNMILAPLKSWTQLWSPTSKAMMHTFVASFTLTFNNGTLRFVWSRVWLTIRRNRLSTVSYPMVV